MKHILISKSLASVVSASPRRRRGAVTCVRATSFTFGRLHVEWLELAGQATLVGHSSLNIVLFITLTARSQHCYRFHVPEICQKSTSIALWIVMAVDHLSCLHLNATRRSVLRARSCCRLLLQRFVDGLCEYLVRSSSSSDGCINQRVSSLHISRVSS